MKKTNKAKAKQKALKVRIVLDLNEIKASNWVTNIKHPLSLNNKSHFYIWHPEASLFSSDLKTF